MSEPNQNQRVVWRSRIVWFALSVIGMLYLAVYNGVGKWGGDIVDAALRKWLPPADVVGSRPVSQPKPSASEEELRRKQLAAWKSYAKCEEKRSSDLLKAQDGVSAAQSEADACFQSHKAKNFFSSDEKARAACSDPFRIVLAQQAGLKSLKGQVCKKPF